MNTSQQHPSQQRAALLLPRGNNSLLAVEQQKAACLRYCQLQGYQLSERHIYQGERVPFEQDAPHLVQLRLALIQGQFDVLVVPFAASLGALPLWVSLPTAHAIDEVYRQQVRIESVIKRYGVHDIYQQMLLDAIRLLEHMRVQQPWQSAPGREWEY